MLLCHRLVRFTSQSTTYVCDSACLYMYVSMSVYPSDLRQFRMYAADKLYACPEVHRDSVVFPVGRRLLVRRARWSRGRASDFRSRGPFGRYTKSRWSLQPGVYARGSKRSHAGGKCVTCRGLKTGTHGFA